MENLKFRAWHSHQCGIHGQLVQWSMDTIIGLRWDKDTLIPMLPCRCYLRNCAFELMQFTGLTDADGKEIYEDDIIQIDRLDSFPSFNIGHVVFHHGAFRLLDKKEAPKIWGFHNIVECTDDKKYGIHHLTDWTILKVLGNLHENPELLDEV